MNRFPFGSEPLYGWDALLPQQKVRALQIALARVPKERLNRSFVLLNDHALRIPGFGVGDLRVPDDYDVCFDRDGSSKFGDRRVRLLKPRAPLSALVTPLSRRRPSPVPLTAPTLPTETAGAKEIGF